MPYAAAQNVIILDEPTVGLDPIQIIEIRELIMELGKTHTVIFFSHILSEVQAICDRILMIAGGKLVAFGTPDELHRELLSAGEIVLTTDAPESELHTILAQVQNMEDVRCGAAEGGKSVSYVPRSSVMTLVEAVQAIVLN